MLIHKDGVEYFLGVLANEEKLLRQLTQEGNYQRNQAIKRELSEFDKEVRKLSNVCSDVKLNLIASENAIKKLQTYGRTTIGKGFSEIYDLDARMITPVVLLQEGCRKFDIAREQNRHIDALNEVLRMIDELRRIQGMSFAVGTELKRAVRLIAEQNKVSIPFGKSEQEQNKDVALKILFENRAIQEIDGLENNVLSWAI